MVEFLVRDYWNKNGSFQGIEKTAVGSQLKGDLLQSCYGMLGVTEEEVRAAADEQSKSSSASAVCRKFQALQLEERKVSLMLASYCLVSDACTDSSGVPLKATIWNDVSKLKAAEVKKLFVEAVDHIRVMDGALVFMRGSILCVPPKLIDLEKTKQAAVRVAQMLYLFARHFCRYPFELLTALGKDKSYRKMVLLAASLGITVEEIFSLFGLSLPNVQWAMQHVGYPTYWIGDNLFLLFHNHSFTYLGRDDLDEIMNKRAIKGLNSVQSF